MISKNIVKHIKSLQLKKYRQQEQLFLVEGAKSIEELLSSNFEIRTLIATPEFFKKVENRINKRNIQLFLTEEDQLGSISTFHTNNSGVAVVESKPNEFINVQDEFFIVLDNISDPGNLGTIIRIADWYGINKIICSETTAEFYNPKVISSSMGSFSRVKVYYTNLVEYLKNNKLPIYGALLEGENIHSFNTIEPGGILIGNESAGISKELLPLITRKINIPRFGSAESLNAAIATAIICDNFIRINQGNDNITH